MRSRADKVSAAGATARIVVLFLGLYLLSGWLRRLASWATSEALAHVGAGFAADAIRFGGGLSALALTVGLVLTYARYAEGRSLRSMGFSPDHVPRQYFKGVGIGLAMICSALLLSWIGGGVRFAGFNSDFSILNFGAALVLGILNIREEVLFRGWLTTSLHESAGVAVAICVSSIAFGLTHIANQNVTVLSIVNIALFGAFLGLYFLRTGTVWGVAAIHSFWNFAQNSLFGLPMSGTTARNSLLRFEGSDGGFFGVGAFGLEGSWTTTVVLIAAIALTVKNFATFVRFNCNTK